ncbi:MAG: class I SAM-dependent RNA methyltransferase [Cyclobacteriaceae bacterium]|nr:class I SAM-dependent RNA methyltransferase [Cyclobacteriaceae bacterium]
MFSFSNTSRIIVTCNKRLTPYVQQEVEELGYFPERVFQTGVELMGTVKDCIRLNINLRCASQVLFSLKEFKARDAERLYQLIINYPWENLLDNDGYFSVTSNVSNPTINNELFVNVKVKDAIVDRMRRQTGKRPDSGSELDGAVIHLYWKDNDAEIFLDTSGETLSKHGYRKIPGRAPMLEALAASTVMATKWDRTSPFVNPMCGSGTVAIEAALLATNRRPGLFRKNYSFMHVIGYEDDLYKNEWDKMKRKIKEVPGLKIIATDIRQDAVNIAGINAKAAGVDQLIEFARSDFERTNIPSGNGVIYFNPEYGERMGELAELEITYKRIGDFMKQQCQGYTGYIFTGNLELAKKIGLKAKRRIEFYNAKLDCRLFEYELYAGSKENRKEAGNTESNGADSN